MNRRTDLPVREVLDGLGIHWADVVFHTRPEGMWEAAIGSLGIDPTTLVPGSGIH